MWKIKQWKVQINIKAGQNNGNSRDNKLEKNKLFGQTQEANLIAQYNTANKCLFVQ